MRSNVATADRPVGGSRCGQQENREQSEAELAADPTKRVRRHVKTRGAGEKRRDYIDAPEEPMNRPMTNQQRPAELQRSESEGDRAEECMRVDAPWARARND